MSLVLAVLVPEFVVQVSETRLSFKNGQPPRDDQRKTLVLFGHGFRGLASWGGLATANPNHNTSDWRVDQLSKLTAEPVDKVVTELAERATSHFATLRDANGATVLAPGEFVLAGWGTTPTETKSVFIEVANYTTQQ